MVQLTAESISRVLTTTLALSRNDNPISLEQIGTKAHVSSRLVKAVLTSILGELDNPPHLSENLRLKLAINAAEIGPLEKVAESLTWQEFERFTEECLYTAGFETETNKVVEGDGRRWQIDVIGTKGLMKLCFDCKHWKPPTYLSKFAKAATHQTRAAQHLLRTTDATINEDETQDKQRVALPIILTLREPPRPIYNSTVLLSVDKLPDFLAKITPVSTGLPFLMSGTNYEANPIKEPEC